MENPIIKRIYSGLQLLCVLLIGTPIMVILFPLRLLRVPAAEFICSRIMMINALSLSHLVKTRVFLFSSDGKLSTVQSAIDKMKNGKTIGRGCICIMNHQLYTDWVYTAIFCNAMNLLVNVKIVLKNSIRKAPFYGFAMNMFGFVFLNRKWATDSSTYVKSLERMRKHPFALILFPEGTTYHPETIQKCNEFAKKNGLVPLKHVLLPRSTGMYAALTTLKCPVIDLTMMISGISAADTPEDRYPIGEVVFGTKCPKTVYLNVDVFETDSMIPLESAESFSDWLYKRFERKQNLLEDFYNGKLRIDEKNCVEIAISPLLGWLYACNILLVFYIAWMLSLLGWITLLLLLVISYGLGFIVI